MFTFLVEGVLMFLVGCLGLGGNLFSLTLLLKRKAQKTFHNLLLLHCSFDMVYLVSAIAIFSLPNLGDIFVGTFQALSSPVMSPLAHIGMVGSIYTALAISFERYLAVVHPFSKFRSEFSTVHFIVPVLLYSLLYNIPKFFELKVSCEETGEDNNSTESEVNQTDSDCNYQLEGRNFRHNHWYVNVYMLWLNTLLNIVLPILSMIAFNIKIVGKLKEYYNYFEENFPCEVFEFFKNERMIRKREVLNSHISLYIALVTLVCHSIRLVPTLWEIYQRLRLPEEEDYPWPAWVEVVTVISHLALTLSASISPYIFPVLYKRSKLRTNQGVGVPLC